MDGGDSDGVCDKTTTERGGKKTGGLSKNSKPVKKSWCIKWNHMGKKCDNAWEGVCVCVCVRAHMSLCGILLSYLQYGSLDRPQDCVWNCYEMQIHRCSECNYFSAETVDIMKPFIMWTTHSLHLFCEREKASCKVDISAVPWMWNWRKTPDGSGFYFKKIQD